MGREFSTQPPRELPNVKLGGPFRDLLTLEFMPNGLSIVVRAADSMHKDDRDKTRIYYPFPHFGGLEPTLQLWLRWVRQCVAEALIHEMDEWLVLQLYNPHPKSDNHIEGDTSLITALLANSLERHKEDS